MDTESDGAWDVTSLRLAISRIARRMRLERTPAELSFAQMAVLLLVNQGGSMTPGRLSELERVRPPTMHRTLAGLSEMGLITRLPVTSDKRRVLIGLTPAGVEVANATRRQREAWFVAQFDSLEPRERAMLIAATPILERLANN